MKPQTKAIPYFWYLFNALGDPIEVDSLEEGFTLFLTLAAGIFVYHLLSSTMNCSIECLF